MKKYKNRKDMNRIMKRIYLILTLVATVHMAVAIPPPMSKADKARILENNPGMLKAMTAGCEPAAAPGHDDVGCGLCPVDGIAGAIGLSSPHEVANELGRHAGGEDVAGESHAGSGVEQGPDGCDVVGRPSVAASRE